MHDHRIDFNGIDWEIPAQGVRHKVSVKEGRRLRLVEFSDSFVEADWCTMGHVGYVVAGRILIDFDGKEIEFNAGDGLFIPAGKAHRHKAGVAKGETALLFLVEEPPG